jgi:FKBP-type peptidyl-prolyl cis-trans isomerase FklB
MPEPRKPVSRAFLPEFVINKTFLVDYCPTPLIIFSVKFPVGNAGCLCKYSVFIQRKQNMTKRQLWLLPLLLISSVHAADLDTNKKKISYIMGLQTANQIKSQGVDLDVDAFALAIKDSLAGNPPRLNQTQVTNAVQQYRQEQAQLEQEHAAQALEQGRKFLQANKSREGVVELASGLQYKVIQPGSGKTPAADDTVEVNYRGTLIDGTEFDSSYKRGKSISFKVTGVIKGWTEALQLMKEGAKWQLFIPSELAYGKRGSGGKIGPNATLIFDVELLKVK